MTRTLTGNDRSAAARSFLAEYRAMCERHQLAFGHEDIGGGFEIHRAEAIYLDWTDQAAEVVEQEGA